MSLPPGTVKVWLSMAGPEGCVSGSIAVEEPRANPP